MIQMTLASKETITRADVPEPNAGEGQVVVKIVRSGICGSDIHAYYDSHPFIDLPVVPGHEFSGIVCALGAGDIKGLTIGDRVTVMPQLYCGQCVNCKSGRYNICMTLQVIGCQAPGASQEKLAVDASLVLKLPDSMDFDHGAMLEPVAVGIHSCKRVIGGVSGKNVLVLGAGTIGNLTAQAAKALGAASVMITDVSGFRLDVAKKCGVEHTVNIANIDLAGEIKKAWGDIGADAIIECVGVAATIEQAIQVGRKGTDIIVAGVFGEAATVSMGLVQDKELNLIGTLMYTKEDWLDAINFVVEGKIVLAPLMSKHFPLAELPEAFKYIEANRDTALKVLMDA